MKYVMVFICLLIVSALNGQFRTLDLVLIDQEADKPIEDAHIFIGSSTYGTISDAKGICQFSFPSDVTQELVISHVSYNLRILKYSDYNILQKNDTIYLKPKGINNDENVISEKNAKEWKRNYRKFSKAFIGIGKRALLCEIKNPEVLRFSEDDGMFKATAIDVLKIKNHYLGYDVDLLLTELTIDENGVMRYVGYSKFTDKTLKINEASIEENRDEAYEKSISHFLLNLISDNLENAKYSINSKKKMGSDFVDNGIPKYEELVFFDSLSGLYHIRFDDFLEVKHLGIKVLSDRSQGVSPAIGETEKLGNGFGDGNSTRFVSPTSMIYKSSPNLIVNQYGRIINQQDVQEYGFFAEQQISNLLPFDYGFDSEGGEILNSNSNDQLQLESEQKKLDTTSLLIVKTLLYGDKISRNKVLDFVENNWKESYIPMLLDVNKVVTSEDINPRVITILVEKAGIYDYYKGLMSLWDGDPLYDEYYADIKGEIYKHIDPQFEYYFKGNQETSEISLDEIMWGGVTHKGIPSLRRPKMMAAEDATYLDGNNIIFGIVIDGEAKAYPKRILAWHEFFVDKIGGKNIAGVYCTLCGTMIAYDMNHKGEIHDLGTSGFLYRSNKLMYDRKTKSLWNTIDGEPVLGPLAGKGIKLDNYPVVTTTWKEWKKKYPETEVLDINTGHKRNYDEGEAYREYFSHDGLMFPVPFQDDRLANKAEVLIIRSPRYETDPLAISIKYLKKKKLHQDVIADKKVVIIADKNGMSRAYYSKNTKFKSYKKGVLKDTRGNIWTVTDDALLYKKRKLLRAPSHNSFWFAWYNMYTDTRLVK